MIPTLVAAAIDLVKIIIEYDKLVFESLPADKKAEEAVGRFEERKKLREFIEDIQKIGTQE